MSGSRINTALLVPKSGSLEDYLKADRYVDWKNEQICTFAADLFADCEADDERAKKAFLFVRDQISHSWDINSKQITISASDVLLNKEGICYAKANLLAALMRCGHIPAGFCYQKLTLGDTPETGYCIHAINAVFLKSLNRWVRLDARGNKKGIHAEYSLDVEKIAFPIRTEYGEADLPGIYADPAPVTMQTLERNTDCIEMCLHDLPIDISINSTIMREKSSE